MWACFGVQPASPSGDADAESVSGASAVGTNNPEHERLARLAWRSAKSAEGRTTVISCVAAEPSLLAKRYGFSDTLLHRAAATGQVALVSAALAIARSNLDALRIAIATRQIALPFAVEKQQRMRLAKLQDDEAVMQKLLNASNNAGMTPLHVAAFHGQTEVLELLLRSGADPCKIDARGNRTPLHCAAITGHADCIDALMAFVNREAAASGEGGAVRGMFRGRRYIDLRTFYGLTALHYAVGRSHTAAAAALLRHEPSLYAVNPKDSTDPMLEVPAKSTPLHLAAAMGDFETCLNILRAYARNRRRRTDPRTVLNSRGRTPHKVAMVAGHRHLGELLHTSGNISTVIRPRPEEEMVPRLAAMAASALQRKLQQELNALDVELQEEQAVLRQQRQLERQQQQEQRAAAARSGGSAGVSSSGVRRPTFSNSGSVAAVSVSSITSTDSSAVCGLCMDRRTNVVAVQCQHTMCSTCALKMCNLVRTQALGCPFCRAPVRAFVAHRAAVPLLATLSLDA